MAMLLFLDLLLPFLLKKTYFCGRKMKYSVILLYKYGDFKIV